MVGFSVGFLSIGNELLDGRTLETNGHFVALELQKFGATLTLTISCKDDIASIHESLSLLSTKCSHIIVSGGLGPTSDDLTRDAIARFANLKLALHSEARQRMIDKFSARKRSMDPTNERQAFFPNGAEPILNDWGSAEGFTLKIGDCFIYSLPGVPKELKPMFTNFVLPALRKQCPSSTSRSVMRFFGLPEATIGSKVESLNCPQDIAIAYRVIFPEIEVSISSSNEEAVKVWGQKIIAAIGEHYLVSRTTDEGLTSALSNLLTSRKKTVAVAESCTAGLVGSALTSLSGASKFFLGGVICYSNKSKCRDLGVNPETIASHGAVSGECAGELARGVRERFNSSFGISITGIAGPDGGTEAKPVGTFFVGLASEDTVQSFPFFFSSDRDRVRRYATFVALDVLRRSVK